MSRMRQVPVMDVTQREKAMEQTMPHQNTMNQAANQRNLPNTTARNYQSSRPRTRKAASTTSLSGITKLRLSDTPALLSSGCSSVREFCTNVQHITTDLNQLISSVENILPLVTAYITALQARNTAAENNEPPIDVTAEPIQQNRPEPAPAQPIYKAPQTPTYTPHAATESAQPVRPAAQPTPSAQTPPMPRPEDLQQLLENPLVKNLMNNFIQNNMK